MSKIDKLTPEQEALIPIYRDKWIKIGLSTEPTNRKRAESVIPAYYAAGKLKAPKYIVWAKSPMETTYLYSVFTSSSFFPSISEAQFEKAIADDTVVELCKQIAPNQKLTFNSNYIGGNLWAGWQAFYDFFKSAVGVEGLDIIQPTLDLSQDVGWIMPWEELVILTEKPTSLYRNNRGQLHSEDGKAIEWSDGFGIYVLNGVDMPAELMVKGKSGITAADVMKLKNVEQRLQAMKYVGIQNFYKSVPMLVVDSGMDHGAPARLIELTIEARPMRFLEMTNPSTGELHVEGVPNELKTVSEAFQFRIPEALRLKYGYQSTFAKT